MPVTIANMEIAAISLVDDDPDALQGYEYVAEDLGAVPVQQTGPLPSIDEFLTRIAQESQAVICDYHLKKRPYADFDGDEFVVKCYQNGFPAVLCTSFTDVDTTLMRSRRRYIPSVVKPGDLDVDTVHSGLERCIRELAGQFEVSRRPWRTLVRIDEIEEEGGYLYVVLPGWNSREKIRLFFDDLPDEVRKRTTPGSRFHAQANVGAESHAELYLTDWEPD